MASLARVKTIPPLLSSLIKGKARTIRLPPFGKGRIEEGYQYFCKRSIAEVSQVCGTLALAFSLTDPKNIGAKYSSFILGNSRYSKRQRAEGRRQKGKD